MKKVNYFIQYSTALVWVHQKVKAKVGLRVQEIYQEKRLQRQLGNNLGLVPPVGGEREGKGLGRKNLALHTVPRRALEFKLPLGRLPLTCMGPPLFPS